MAEYDFVKSTNPSQEEWLSGMGINADTYNGFDSATKRGILDSYNKSITPGLASNGYKDYMGQDVLGGLTTKGGLQDIGTGMGIVGAGYNIYDSAFGKTAKLNDKKMELMDQQIASNKQNMANKDTFNTTWAGASNGLAAKYATPRVG